MPEPDLSDPPREPLRAENFKTQLHGYLSRRIESGLFEMMIGRQGIGQVPSSHHGKARAIDQAPGLARVEIPRVARPPRPRLESMWTISSEGSLTHICQDTDL